MRKRNLFLAIFMLAAFMVMVLPSYSASLVTNLGIPNSSGVGPLQIDSDRIITIAADAGINYSYEASITSDTLTAAESGKTLSMACQTPCEVDLPAAEAGMSFNFVSIDDAATFTVDPDGTDRIYAGIATLVAGSSVVSPGNTGDVLKIFSTADGYWSVPIEIGTFTDGG